MVELKVNVQILKVYRLKKGKKTIKMHYLSKFIIILS